MDVYRWNDTHDKQQILLTPGKTLPPGAANLAKGKWVLGPVLSNLQANDSRIALDSNKAIAGLQANGYYLAKFQIKTTVNDGGSKK